MTTATLEQLAADDGASLIGYIADDTNAVARTAEDALREHLSILDFGCVGDNSTDNGPAFRNALAAAAALGRALFVPAGIFVITDLTIEAEADEYVPPENALIFGAGPGSVLHFTRSNFTAVYGLSLRHSGVTLRDLSLEVDVNGGSWCAALGFTDDTANHLFDNVRFAGTDARTGHRCGVIIDANVDDVQFVNCNFELLEAASPVKDNGEDSSQRNFNWSGCAFRDCGDAVNINSPLGSWQGVSIANCDFSDIVQWPISLAAASRVSIAGNRFTNCRVEAIHIEAASHDVDISGNSFVLCNVSPGVINYDGSIVAGANGAVHVIAGCYDIRLRGNGFDLTQNGGTQLDPVRLATTADITLSGTQTIDGVAAVANDRVLVKNQSTASQNGIWVMASGAWSRASDFDGAGEALYDTSVPVTAGSQAGNWVLITPDPITLGSTAQTWTEAAYYGVSVSAAGGDDPYNIAIDGNSFLLKAGTFAIFAQNVGQGAAGGLEISNNVFENIIVGMEASKSAMMLRLLFSPLSGSNNRFINPGVVLSADDFSYGGLRDSQFLGDLATLDLLSANGDAATSVVFQNFMLKRSFTANSSASWQDICPDGTLYDGIASLRYIGNGTNDSFTKTTRLTGDSGALTIASEQVNSVGGVDPIPGAPNWRVNGGKLQSKAYRASTQYGQIMFTFQGPWFA